jgi:hypothetical protein
VSPCWSRGTGGTIEASAIEAADGPVSAALLALRVSFEHAGIVKALPVTSQEQTTAFRQFMGALDQLLLAELTEQPPHDQPHLICICHGAVL